jgi:hypothetical protein
MSAVKAHIRNEKLTRERHGLVGNDKELDDYLATRDLCAAWCGADASGTWFYRSIDHAVLAAGDPQPPCPACVQAIEIALRRAIGASAVTKIDLSGDGT